MLFGQSVLVFNRGALIDRLRSLLADNCLGTLIGVDRRSLKRPISKNRSQADDAPVVR